MSWETWGLVAAVLTLFYAWMRHRYAYWKRRGVKFIKPLPLFGNMLPILLQKEPFTQIMLKQYLELKSNKCLGSFGFLTPSLTIFDPDLIRDCTVKYFDHFHDRSSAVNDKTDPLIYKALISLKGQEWREMRNILSPAFTTSKLRAMFPMISKCGEQFASFFLSRSDSKSPIEFKSTFTRYTTDVIATVAFGMETNAVNNPDEEFYKFGQKITDFRGIRLLIGILYSIIPKIMVFLNISLMSRDITTFFRGIIYGTKKHRLENNITRPDMIQLLMAAQHGGIEKEHEDNQMDTVGESTDALNFHRKHLAPETNIKKEITDDDIAAQAFLFFLAGSDTVSTVLSFLAHELAVNPDVQDRLREEITSAIKQNDGKLTYDLVQNMKYLDMVVAESLRKFPPAAFTERCCTKNFNIPKSDIVLEKGISVIIPIYSLHNDPEFFPNPNQFDPERFSEENKKNIKPYTYIPFGSGPHNCIGIRLGLLQVKMCIVYLLAACELQVSCKTEVPLQLSKTTFQMTTDAGFWLLCVPNKDPTSINV